MRRGARAIGRSRSVGAHGFRRSADHDSMRTVPFAALIVGVLLVPTALGMARMDHDRDVSQVERMLVAEADEHGGALENYFARARSVVLLTANSPAFANVLAERGTR